jgi:GntR family transcriptional regulator
MYQRLRDTLAERISLRDWAPSVAIPSEAELAAEHRVSIGTVRKAIDLLVAEGQLERFQGKGTFVRRPTFDTSLFRFFRFQQASGQRRIPESSILKRGLAKVPHAAAEALGLTPGVSAIHISRLRLLDGKPLLVEDIWLHEKPFLPLLELEPSRFGALLYPLYETQCGQVVASADETLTAEAIGARDARLLGIPEGAPAIVIERLARGTDRHPLEWRRSRGPASQFRYHIEIR